MLRKFKNDRHRKVTQPKELKEKKTPAVRFGEKNGLVCSSSVQYGWIQEILALIYSFSQ